MGGSFLLKAHHIFMNMLKCLPHVWHEGTTPLPNHQDT